MGLFKNIFTWWEGATFGTALNTMARGISVGKDGEGNTYYQSRKETAGVHRRWVIYAGSNDASRVPPEWHGWLHHTHEAPPMGQFARTAALEDESAREPTVNPTGTTAAYRPAGAPETGAKRARATGDYVAWSPEAA